MRPALRVSSNNEHLTVCQDAIWFSAVPKHASFYIHTAEIALAILEAADVPPARA